MNLSYTVVRRSDAEWQDILLTQDNLTFPSRGKVVAILLMVSSGMGEEAVCILHVKFTICVVVTVKNN